MHGWWPGPVASAAAGGRVVGGRAAGARDWYGGRRRAAAPAAAEAAAAGDGPQPWPSWHTATGSRLGENGPTVVRFRMLTAHLMARLSSCHMLF